MNQKIAVEGEFRAFVLVYERGQRVRIQIAADDPEAIEGHVVAVMIVGANVSYKVVYWNGRSREEKWCEDYELHALDSMQRLAIGFRLNGESSSGIV